MTDEPNLGLAPPPADLKPIESSSSSTSLARASLSPSPSSARLAPPAPGFVLPPEEGGGAFGTLLATFYAVPSIEAGAISTQMYHLGLRALPFLCLVQAFVGSIFVYQAGVQSLRLIPDLSALGSSFIELLVRELAPTITALMIATRVGAGIAAELGSMRVTDQLDALRLCKADPVVFLVAPRVLACLLLTPVVTIIAGTVALTSGVVTAYIAFGVNPATFLDARYVTLGALFTCFLKTLAFGLAVPVISAHAGLYTRGGSQGVGDATTRAVVGSSLAVVFLGFLLGAIAQALGVSGGA